jgi:PLP dependent protein
MSLAENLREVGSRVAAACERAGREPRTVELIAVSKTFPVEAIRQAREAGQLVFGESRQQEAEPKIEVLPADLCWHFIGRVQRNKVRKLLPVFAVIHGLDSLRLARYVNEVGGELGLRRRVFLQVNLAGEAGKGGFSPGELKEAIRAVVELPHLEVLGLMAIPPAVPEPELARTWFRQLRELRDEVESSAGVSLPSLSMGMSADYEVAIEEGATHVRVGSAIFGGRVYEVDAARG